MPIAGTAQGQSTRPDVSFAVACFNGQPFLRQAIESALGQSDVTVEVIVVDDGSTDDSFEEAREMASIDTRIRVFKTPHNGGPSAARNIALDEMTGDWFAILDSDDFIAANRTRTLMDAADSFKADLIADDLIIFGKGILTHSAFNWSFSNNCRQLEIGEYFKNSQLFSKKLGFGFLKPMIRAKALKNLNVRYNPNLRIAEDDELIVRLLMGFCKYYLYSEAMYHYRKHPNSISHRLSVGNAEKMLESEYQIRYDLGEHLANSIEYKLRFSALSRGVAFVKSVEHLKNGEAGKALLSLLKEPKAAFLYRLPLSAAVERFFGKSQRI
jgi:succinoglycan biosynthesis protein ExoO